MHPRMACVNEITAYLPLTCLSTMSRTFPARASLICTHLPSRLGQESDLALATW